MLLHSALFLYAPINKLLAARSNIVACKSVESPEGESAGFCQGSQETSASARTHVFSNAATKSD